MTKKEFLQRISNGQSDVLQDFLDAIASLEIDYCVIGGLAVNAYVEPVVSLDLDVVVTADDIEGLCHAVEDSFAVEEFEHSINLNSADSDLRIQLQTDSRYQAFLGKAVEHEVLGYMLNVAAVEDVLQGKLWAYGDENRRMSKRQKDLADIFRIVEAFPGLVENLPEAIRAQF